MMFAAMGISYNHINPPEWGLIVWVRGRPDEVARAHDEVV